MPVKLVIFDLDGTLVDTSEDIAASLNAAVTPLGLEPFSIEETVALVGEGLSRLMEKVLEPKGLIERHKEVMEAFLSHYGEHLSDRSRAYPGVEAALSSLKQVGLRLAVLSNKRESFSRQLLEDLGMLQYFELVAGADSVPEKKPSPVAVEFVLEHFGMEKEEALMVGDSDYDIQAAQGAGVRVAAVTWGFRPAGSLQAADYLIDDIAELLSVPGL